MLPSLSCDGLDRDETPPFDPGCLDDEYGCSALDSDPHPVRYSTGGVETNPVTVFSVPTPSGVFFGVEAVYGSNAARRQATRHGLETQPSVKRQDEFTHFLGEGWSDNVSDRLIIAMPGLTDGYVAWVSSRGIVTFVREGATSRYVSHGRRFELVDRGGAQTPRWILRTTAADRPIRFWGFDDQEIVTYGGNTGRIGKLLRHGLATGVLDVTGYYRYDVTWTVHDVVEQVVDTLGRRLTYSYNQAVDGPRVISRSLQAVSYSAAPGTPSVEVARFTYQRGTYLDRISRPATAGYARFLYWNAPGPPTCDNCRGLLTDVVAAAEAAATPAPGAPIQASELVLEHHDYEIPSDGRRPRAVRSDGPDGAYGYVYQGATTVQHDLRQAGGACSAGTCDAGYRCWALGEGGDDQCYTATTYDHEPSTRLQIAVSTSAGEETVRTYGPEGAPRSTTGPDGVITSYGFDSHGNLRCLVRNDDDDEAFADPDHPDTSTCAPPANQPHQTTLATHGAGFSARMYPSAVAPGLQVTISETRDSRRLVTAQTQEGWTRTVDGAIVSQTRSTSYTHDAMGRIVQVDGPRPNSIARDTVDIVYWTAPPGGKHLNEGQVRSVTRYVGTTASSYPLTVEYDEYDAWGVPHRITEADGTVTTLATTDRLTWTVSSPGAGTRTVRMNRDGTLRSVVDGDGICTTFDYGGGGGGARLAAPARVKVTSSASPQCGALPVNINTGLVEVRDYRNGEPGRIERVRHYDGGVLTYERDGLDYEPISRVASLATLDSSDVFYLGLGDGGTEWTESPGWPQDGAWRTSLGTDMFRRPTSVHRAIDASSRQETLLTYASANVALPTTLTRGKDGSVATTTTFAYDDFGAVVEAITPNSGTTRFEYDVVGNPVKTRVGVGTALVSTTVSTFDSVGRLVSVDNDVEHPVSCASAPIGTPIADAQYAYDTCTGPTPAGISCTNTMGRLRAAVSTLHCGSDGQPVSRGRWYSYDGAGRPTEVAFSTITGGTVGTPAVMSHGWSPGGRPTSIGSPLNSAYGAVYSYDTSSGQTAMVRRGTTSGPIIAQSISYTPFGPLRGYRAGVAASVSGGVAYLDALFTHRMDHAPSSLNWDLGRDGAAPVQHYMNQTLAYAPSGVVATRTDTAEVESSRHYAYDNLVRLRCEAGGEGSTQPTAADCVTTSSRLLNLFTYFDGATATAPPENRASIATRRASSGTTVELATYGYAAGSDRLTSILSPASGARPVGHDTLGRRSVDNRLYSYLPNGQVGRIQGRAPGVQYDLRVNYDTDGRPLTIVRSYQDAGDDSLASKVAAVPGDSGTDTYELFYDEANRLIAAQIGSYIECTSQSTTRWHYHYLGQQPIAATREFIPGPPPPVCSTSADGPVAKADVPGASLTHFWFVFDERGVVQRAIASNGAEHYRAQLDAFGVASVSVLADGFWMPFALAGQLRLVGTADRAANDLAITMRRVYDPATGSFLTPDPADLAARLGPEGYVYAHQNPMLYSDPTGGNSTPLGPLPTHPFSFDSNCSPVERFRIASGTALAYQRLTTCMAGLCTEKETADIWRDVLMRRTFSCPKRGETVSARSVVGPTGHIVDDSYFLPFFGNRTTGALLLTNPVTLETWVSPIQFDRLDLVPQGPECFARELAHEALHVAYQFVAFSHVKAYMQRPLRPARVRERIASARGAADHTNLHSFFEWLDAGEDQDSEEDLANVQAFVCFFCTDP